MSNYSIGTNFIFLDSKDRSASSNSTSDCIWTINDNTTNLKKKMSIESIIIPNSYYSINTNNNTFLLEAETITLTPGNYNSTTFNAELLTKLNASTFGIAHPFSSATYNSTTGKNVIINGTTNFTITSNAYNYRYLGLPPSTALASSTLTWTSTNVCDFSGTRYISIITDLPIASANSSNFNNNVLTRVWCNTSSFNTIFYSSQAFDYIKLLTTKLNTISLRLVDEFGSTVDLNGLQWSVVLEVEDQPDTMSL